MSTTGLKLVKLSPLPCPLACALLCRARPLPSSASTLGSSWQLRWLQASARVTSTLQTTLLGGPRSLLAHAPADVLFACGSVGRSRAPIATTLSAVGCIANPFVHARCHRSTVRKTESSLKRLKARQQGAEGGAGNLVMWTQRGTLCWAAASAFCCGRHARACRPLPVVADALCSARSTLPSPASAVQPLPTPTR